MKPRHRPYHDDPADYWEHPPDLDALRQQLDALAAARKDADEIEALRKRLDTVEANYRRLLGIGTRQRLEALEASVLTLEAYKILGLDADELERRLAAVEASATLLSQREGARLLGRHAFRGPTSPWYAAGTGLHTFPGSIFSAPGHKREAATLLVVQVNLSLYTAHSSSHPTLGVWCNRGNKLVDASFRYLNNADRHESHSFSAVISGVTPGAFQLSVYAKTPSGTSVKTDSNSHSDLLVWEVPAP